MRGWILITTLAVTLPIASPPSIADDGLPAALRDEVSVDDQIADWIRQLNSSQFAKRDDASRKLRGLGAAAIPALAKAATGDSREVTLRALEILKQHFREGDAGTKEDAEAALKKLADSDHPSAARRAKDILEPPQPPAARVNAAQAFQMPIQIRVQAGGGGANQVRQIQIANGVKKIEARDGDRQVKITENANGSIQMEIISKVDGKEQTKKYEAKNADELKKKDPEAHKLYEKYAQQNVPVIQFNQAFQRIGVPNLAPANAPLKPVQTRMAEHRLKAAGAMIDQAIKDLERQGEDQEKPEKAVERLKKIRDQLKQEQERLGEAP
jgi:hypothetical protein